MDALFEAINVRELLSSSSVDPTDPTTPLSAPDLRLLVTRLESHSLQIKSRVRSHLLAHRDDFSSFFSLCNDAVSSSDQINRSLSDLFRFLSDSPVDREIREVLEEVRERTREAREKREALEIVRAVLEIGERLGGVRNGIRAGDLRFAAEEVRDLKDAVRVRDREEEVDVDVEGEPVIYGVLKKEWLGCFEEIQEVLVRFVGSAVLFEPESRRVRVNYRPSSDQSDLHSVLEAMDAVGVLDYGLAKVSDQMIKFVIAPAISFGSHVSIVEEVKETSAEMVEASLTVVSSPDDKIQDVDGESIYQGIIQVVKFVSKCLCFQNGSWIRCFGRLTWPRISELIISNFLSKSVPEDASKLIEFQKIIKRTTEFEVALKEMNFLSAFDETEMKLSTYAEVVEVHFGSRKKIEMLAKTRNLLLQCDFVIPQAYKSECCSLKNDGTDMVSSKNVVDLLFLGERCVVSAAASQLMELVHQTLKDACLSSPRVAVEFYHAARDAMLLYEAIIPVKLERQLNGINQAAVLMHNDCLYLSQEILGLAFEYRANFPVSIKEHAVFVDIAPRFKIMAEEVLERQIRLVIFNLKEAIDGADCFQNTHQIQQYESAKFSIDQVVFILEKVHRIWEPLLLSSTYKKSLCTVLESVFCRITVDILLLDDMAAEETLQLQRLIHLLLENLSSLIESLNAVGKDKPGDYTRSSRDYSIPSLRKIRKLAELLDMPLKSITAAWENGDLLRSGFAPSEVKNFVKAIFTDSPLRKECLWRIENVR